MSGLSKSDYDYINLGVCIKGQADRLGIEHEGIPLEGVVVRLANATPPGSERADREPSDAAVEAAARRTAEYAAVVEKVRSVIERESGWFRYRAEQVSAVLASAPADALREHDAKVRAEALREAYADLQAYTDSGAPFGRRPVEEFLLHRADRIEREAGLK